MLDPTFVIGWVVIIGAGLIWEAIALMRKRKGDTLSEATWFLLRQHTIVWFVALGIFGWVGVHFFARTWLLP